MVIESFYQGSNLNRQRNRNLIKRKPNSRFEVKTETKHNWEIVIRALTKIYDPTFKFDEENYLFGLIE